MIQESAWGAAQFASRASCWTGNKKCCGYGGATVASHMNEPKPGRRRTQNASGRRRSVDKCSTISNVNWGSRSCNNVRIGMPTNSYVAGSGSQPSTYEVGVSASSSHAMHSMLSLTITHTRTLNGTQVSGRLQIRMTHAITRAWLVQLKRSTGRHSIH